MLVHHFSPDCRSSVHQPSVSVWSIAQLPVSPGLFARNRLSRSPVDPQCLLFSCSSLLGVVPCGIKIRLPGTATWRPSRFRDLLCPDFLFLLWLFFFFFFTATSRATCRPGYSLQSTTTTLGKNNWIGWDCVGTTVARQRRAVGRHKGRQRQLIRWRRAWSELVLRTWGYFPTPPLQMSLAPQGLHLVMPTCFSKPSRPTLEHADPPTYPLRGCSSPVWIFKLPKFV
jgi:hypothetical protein